MRSFFTKNRPLINPLFIATVEDNKDPTFSYRVKARIDEIHPANITTEQLPWVARVDTAFMGMSESADLDHKIPEVGSKILVLTVANDLNSLVYIGTLYKNTPQTPTGNGYLDTYGVYRANGQFIGVDKIQKLFQMLFDGDIIIDKVHQANIKISDKISVECPATVITGDVRINGNLKVSDNIIGGEVKTMAGIDLNTHVHSGIFPGPANTTGPVPGA